MKISEFKDNHTMWRKCKEIVKRNVHKQMLDVALDICGSFFVHDQHTTHRPWSGGRFKRKIQTDTKYYYELEVIFKRKEKPKEQRDKELEEFKAKQKASFGKVFK